MIGSLSYCWYCCCCCYCWHCHRRSSRLAIPEPGRTSHTKNTPASWRLHGSHFSLAFLSLLYSLTTLSLSLSGILVHLIILIVMAALFIIYAIRTKLNFSFNFTFHGVYFNYCVHARGGILRHTADGGNVYRNLRACCTRHSSSSSIGARGARLVLARLSLADGGATHGASCGFPPPPAPLLIPPGCCCCCCCLLARSLALESETAHRRWRTRERQKERV